jgi:hypothetical protein
MVSVLAQLARPEQRLAVECAADGNELAATRILLLAQGYSSYEIARGEAQLEAERAAEPPEKWPRDEPASSFSAEARTIQRLAARLRKRIAEDLRDKESYLDLLDATINDLHQRWRESGPGADEELECALLELLRHRDEAHQLILERRARAAQRSHAARHPLPYN